ncbi:hypothetical protein [Roseobacter sp. MH60115]|uniref:hypothetical protein n=1 Tax=Roseobacter sp. MH60115 TaxID=2785324 RepID=UPI0018A31E3F|nr:hypothetical protein [Roseobacter sp. MH60115]
MKTAVASAAVAMMSSGGAAETCTAGSHHDFTSEPVDLGSGAVMHERFVSFDGDQMHSVVVTHCGSLTQMEAFTHIAEKGAVATINVDQDLVVKAIRQAADAPDAVSLAQLGARLDAMGARSTTYRLDRASCGCDAFYGAGPERHEK